MIDYRNSVMCLFVFISSENNCEKINVRMIIFDDFCDSRIWDSKIIIIASVWTLKWKFCFVKFLKFHPVWPWMTFVTLLQWYCLSRITWSIIRNRSECFQISLNLSEYRFGQEVKEGHFRSKERSDPKDRRWQRVYYNKQKQ